MEKNDYNKWFISGTTAVRCPMISFKSYCKKLFGKGWYEKYRMFHRASLEEYNKFELYLINE